MNKKKLAFIIIGGIFALLLITFLILLIVAYTNPIQSNKDENGNYVYTDERGIDIWYETLPADVSYNGKSVTLTDVRVFQDYIGYQYYLFVTATYDISELTESEIHWLTTEDFKGHAYITSEQNSIDFEPLKLTDWTYDSKSMVVSFSSLGKSYVARHDFSDLELTVVGDFKQEEEYEYENDDGEISFFNKTNSIHYSISPEYVPLPEECT